MINLSRMLGPIDALYQAFLASKMNDSEANWETVEFNKNGDLGITRKVYGKHTFKFSIKQKNIKRISEKKTIYGDIYLLIEYTNPQEKRKNSFIPLFKKFTSKDTYNKVKNLIT